MRRFCYTLLLLAWAAPALVSAQTVHQPTRASTDTALPTLTAVRTDTRPVIDGRLDDPEWADAPVATDFVQTRPHAGRPASQRTEVRILYDDAALYVAARMYDTAPDSIVAQLARRDVDVHSDWFHVGIDSYFDRRTAFTFGINPAGVKVDLLLFDDTNADMGWDAVWEGAAQRDEHGWTAEFRIPFSQLRFSPPQAGHEQVWGLNFRRHIARSGEESYWAPLPPDNAQVVSLFGILDGLRDLRPPRRLEVMPYAVARATRAPGDAADPFHRSVDPSGGLGADLKAGITSDLTLTATINPDFGQVEADPSVVNLTTTETFFPERRPFFVEGVDIFRFGIGLGDGDLGNEGLFYSRRIGRPPQGSLGGDFTRRPDYTRIAAAAKLSGKTAGGWSIGFLDAITAEETGRFQHDGVTGEAPIEPLTNYAVGRVIKDFRDGRSAFGGIATATNRRLPATGELDWMRSAAYTGGLNVRHRFGDDAYQVAASVVGSRIRGTPSSMDLAQRSPVRYFQRPDADHLQYDAERTSLEGYGATADLWKLRGNWRFALLGRLASPGLEVNDLGFQTSADQIMGVYWVGYQQYEPRGSFRSWNIGHNAWTGVNFGGDRIARGGNVNGGFQHRNFWGGNMGINVSTEELSASMLRGGPMFLRPAMANLWASLHSDRRRTVSVSGNLNGSRQADTGGRGIGLSTGMTVRPAHNADFFVGPFYGINRNPIQYVTTRVAGGTSHAVLGTVDQTTVAMTMRLNYTFSPALSLQLYAQPFISTGDYSAFKLVTDPRAPRFDDRVHVLTDAELSSTTVDGGRRHAVDLTGDGTAEFHFDDPGFNFRQLRSNVVLRWEYRPGSALFLVWSQGRTDLDRDGRFRFGDDASALWSADGTNVLLIKASYWFGL
jgi:hypothetical protein